jgi:signal transduction histidine kinase/DNA-binding response OmpR family regulator/HPt (histidine-containing phosphotransfer) domain-containing protein
VKIRRASQVTTAAIVLVSLIAFVCLLVARQSWIVSRGAYEARLAMLAHTDRLVAASDRMTDAVRAFATTGDRRHYDGLLQALQAERKQELSVDGLRRMGFTDDELALLARARHQAERLAGLDQQAIAAVDAGKLGEAIRIVYGPEYGAAKNAVIEPIAEARRQLEQRLADNAAELAQRGKVLNDLALLALLVSAAIVLAVLVLFYQRRVVNPLVDIDASLRALIARQDGAGIGHQEDRSEIGELARSIEQYRLTVAEADRQRWVKTSLAEIADGLLGIEQPTELGGPLLSSLMPLLGGGRGAFHLFDEADGRYHFAGGYGLAASPTATAFAAGEGMAGQAAAERRTIRLTDPHDDNLRLGSAPGQAPSRLLVAVPLLVDDTVPAVLEIAIFGALTPEQHSLLDDVAPMAALKLDVLQRSLRTRQLLDQVQASEAELRHINFLADSALDLTKAGYWHVPLDGTGWYNSSERAARIFGDLSAPGHRYQIAEWSQNVFAGDEEAAKATMEHFSAAIAGTIPVYDSTYAYKRPVDGRVVWIHALGHVVKNAAGEATDIFGVTQDITEFKTLEMALTGAKQKAEEATQMKSMFLANMSHEIRTPMNAIIGLSHLALRTPLNAKQRDYLTKIHTAGTSLLAVINDILDFSKIEAGKLSIESTAFRLDEVIDSVITVTGQKAHEKGLEFLAHLPASVPQCLVGDPLRLGQILTNLVSNAVKFTERGEIRLRVEALESSGERCQLRFSVQDTGIGMTREQADRLFQPFTQGDMSTTRKHGGTGLGLTICRRLVEMMEGQIGLESEPDVGTTVSFTAWFGVGEPKAAGTVVPEGLASLRVLVADDNAAASEIIQEALRGMVQCVDVVSSGPAAVAEVRLMDARQPYDVVYMDWRMPGMDGLQAARLIRGDESLHQQPAIVLVTAFGREEIRDEAEHLQLDGYLLKPLTRSMLVDSLVNVVGAGTPEAPLHAEPAQSPRFPGLRVLLVEDNDINQQIATELLEGAGASVEVAHHGRQAVDRLLGGGDYHLVLMDLQMPEMDGYQATARIRAEPRLAQLPIIAMTAHATTEERQRCLDAGMNDHVAKPIDPVRLFAALGRYYAPTLSPATPDAAPPADGEAIPAIEGLAVEDVLARIGGNRELYRKLLRQFLIQASVPDEIERALAAGDWPAAERLAHTVHGVAANLGAHDVQASAADLEQALRERAEAQTVAARQDAFRANLDAFVARLRAALPPDPAADAATVQAVDPQQLAAVAAQMLGLLGRFDAAATELFDTHRDLFRALLPPDRFHTFEAQITGYAFAEARTTLAQAAAEKDLALP